MKKQILNLGRKLSRAEQQKINGGSGSCQYYNGALGCRMSGLTSSGAQAQLHTPLDHWCCESCDTASWAGTQLCNHHERPTRFDHVWDEFE